MMNRYEVLVLAVPEITRDESNRIHTELDTLVRSAQGSVISFEKWGKYRLAYPIQKKEYGVYFLTRFEVEKSGELLDEIKRLFRVRMNTVVMRHMLSALESGQSLEYERPLSLEESPEKEVGAFLKDNKVQGFLKGRGPRQGSSGRRYQDRSVEAVVTEDLEDVHDDALDEEE